MYYVNQRAKNLYRVFDQNGRKGFLRLDLNENPVGLPKEFIEKNLKDIDSEFVAMYPETRQFAQALAQFLGTDSSYVCITNGSAEAIRYAIQAFTSEGGRMVGVVPSYFMFQIYAEMYGRSFIPIEYTDDLEMDVDNILKEMTPDTEMLILLNPNNPMGNVYSEDEMARIIKKAEENEITILIDEAYYYFYPKTFIKYALEREHILVVRTFSKMFSMAGCRLGYIVGWPEGIQVIQNLCTPHNTNAFALRFAQAIIEDTDLIQKMTDDFNEGRAFLINELEKNHYKYRGEAGNFLFIKPKTDADDVVKKMKGEKKILIKSYDGVGKFGKCLRVSIGNKDVMQKFMDALLEVDE